MENSGRLYSQVAAEAGVSPDKAMVACYLSNLSRQGRTLDEAAALLRKPRSDARDYARDWGISFPDYAPSPEPLSLTWTKEKRGRYVLDLGGVLVAYANSDGKGGYIAQKSGDAHRFYGSNAEVAIRRLSIELERQSLTIFGVDDVAIYLELKDSVLSLAPKRADDPCKLQKALASA